MIPYIYPVQAGIPIKKTISCLLFNNLFNKEQKQYGSIYIICITGSIVFHYTNYSIFQYTTYTYTLFLL